MSLDRTDFSITELKTLDRTWYSHIFTRPEVHYEISNSIEVTRLYRLTDFCHAAPAVMSVYFMTV